MKFKLKATNGKISTKFGRYIHFHIPFPELDNCQFIKHELVLDKKNKFVSFYELVSVLRWLRASERVCLRFEGHGDLLRRGAGVMGTAPCTRTRGLEMMCRGTKFLFYFDTRFSR